MQMAARLRTGGLPAVGDQLSLFSEGADPELADNLEEESFDDRNGSAHTSGASDPGSLETPPPVDGAAIGTRESPPTGDLRSPGVDGQSPVRTDGSAEDRVSPGLGNRDEGMGLSSGRGGSTQSV